MAHYVETDHITDVDGHVFIVLDNEIKVVDSDCDVMVQVDGQYAICIPGNHLREVLAKLNAVDVDAVETAYHFIHKDIK